MTDQNQLLPCPFCGSSNVGIYSVEGQDNHSIECYECLAGGKPFKTVSEAISAWNTRTAQPAEGGEVVYVAEGHLREVLNGNTMNAYLSPEPDRFAQVPLTLATTKPEPMTEEQADDLISDLSEWSGYVEVDFAPRSLEKHVREVLAKHGIKGQA